MRRQFLRILLGLLMAMTTARSGAAVSLDNVNGVIATVGDYVITVQEVRAGMIALGRTTSMSPEDLMAYVLKQLIEDKLILTDFHNSEFKIPDAYFDDAFEQMIKNTYDDRLQFVQSLKQNGQHIEEVRNEFRERRIINLMSNFKINQQIAISPFKIERYYQEHMDEFAVKEQVKLRMIIIPARGATDAEARARAEMVYGKLVDGEDFAELARQYSTGIYAREGGLMEWQLLEDARSEIAEVATDMNAGETSNPIVTSNAIFIVRLEEKKEPHVEPLSEVREDIERKLISDETARLRARWIEELKETTFVKRF